MDRSVAQNGGPACEDPPAMTPRAGASACRCGGASRKASARATVEQKCRELPMPKNGLPPVVLLGGDANALSVARSLDKLGATVYALGERGSCARHTRHCRWITAPAAESPEAAWAAYLLGPESDHLIGAVVLACSDAGIQMIAHNRDALLLRYRLDESDPDAQLAMLDKLGTYRSALAAGVPTPRFWIAETRAQLESLRGELVFPLIVKPRLAHRAKKTFRNKHARVETFAELVTAFEADRAAAVDVLLMEWIPGGDDTLCSYYTYLDADGRSYFDFTKRVIRRYPTGMGLGCYHMTDEVPGVKELGLRLFRHVGLRGLANVEFKLDPRDGQYKLIECNARFTAANGLVTAAGIDLSRLVYCRAAGLPLPPLDRFRSGVRVIDPVLDLLSFLELRRAGELTFGQWVRSLMHRQTFGYFRWTDPLPALARCWKMLTFARRRKTPPESIGAQQAAHAESLAEAPAAAA
jgi:predicted ATP-grasp superfamily ATP-dependent carboligase